MQEENNETTNVSKEDFDQSMNALSRDKQEVFIDNFLTKMYSQGITQDIDANTIQRWLANPDDFQKEIEKLAQYYYISNGDIFQQFELTRILPTLNYKIKCADSKKGNYEKNLSLCNKTLRKVNHKELTRDIISQLITAGTLVGVWLGEKNDSYLHLFDNLEYFFPAHRQNGKWTVWVDLSYYQTLSETQRGWELDNLSPYVSQYDYDEYRKNPEEYRYIELPLERSVCLRTHTLKRNQRFGVPWVTPALYDLMHKKKLKDLEKSVANKIINSIAVLKIGNKENTNLKLDKNVKKKVYGGVKTALEKNQSQGVTVVGIPEFADLEFADMKSDALDPKKFESINDEVTNATGISKSITNGSGDSYAIGKLNLDVVYKRIGAILENIENEVYNKLFNLILPKSLAYDYEMVYDKETPLSMKEKVDILTKLHSEGFAIKQIIDMLDGIDYQDYINQSIYEIEELKLREKIIPPQLSYTTAGGENDSGAPTVDNPDNENTDKTQSTGGNSLPKVNS